MDFRTVKRTCSYVSFTTTVSVLLLILIHFSLTSNLIFANILGDNKNIDKEDDHNHDHHDNDDDGQPFLRPGIEVSEVLRARGFETREHDIVVDDGYIIGLTQAKNPHISLERRRELNLDPILLVHGSITNAMCFVVVAGPHARATSSDLNELISPAQVSANELIDQLENEPSINSLPMLLMNFGHEVWFMHKRGTKRSRRRVSLPANRRLLTPYQKLMRAHRLFNATHKKMAWQDFQPGRGHTEIIPMPSEATRADSIKKNEHKMSVLQRISSLMKALKVAPAGLANDGKLLEEIAITFDRKLWNHSLDEQAAYDVPRAVQYVLKHSEPRRKKCIYVGDSGGGSIGVMTLILNPELNEQLSKVVLIAPAFNLGTGMNGMLKGINPKKIPTIHYTGPFPFTFVTKPAQALLQIMCSVKLIQETLCQKSAFLSIGPSRGQTPMFNELYSMSFVPVSAFEYFQFLQFFLAKKSHLFDYGKEKNQKLYGGAAKPPLYDLGLITNPHITIWASKDDSMITNDDMRAMMKQMRVRHKYVYVNNSNITVNHGSFNFHSEAGRIIYVPVLKDIMDTESEEDA